ncbi:hypothetical protein FB451DRAFT_1121576 [Mycena latifolia]|nr:hypothetical protein FB451DRAFT_1121576 [Mycena latifolia]
MTLHSPAVDLLWRSAQLLNLLCCLPPDLVEVTKPQSLAIKYTMRFLRPIKNSDWDRVLAYSTRVKHLFSSPDYFELSAAFPSISLSLPTNLLPNLQHLHWFHGESDFHYIQLFLRPELMGLTIPCTSQSPQSLFATLAFKCPNLTDVYLLQRIDAPSMPDIRHDSQAIASISAFVCGLQSLKTISAPVLDRAALEHLQHLPSLREINLRALPTTLSVAPIGPTTSFPSLHTLELSAEMEAITLFLSWFNPRVSLTTIDLIVPVFATAHQTHELCTALAADLSHSSLTHLQLNIDSHNFDTPAAAQFHLQPPSIRILFCFVNLTTVSIVSPIGINLDNDTVTEMARTWNQIESLELSSFYSPPTGPRITLECLEVFARYCPQLQSLSLAFDATVIPVFTGSRPRVAQNSLKRLDVQDSGIVSPIAVARFLSSIFPSLNMVWTIRTGEDNDDEDEIVEHGEAIERHRLWKEVETLLPHLVEIRAEERAQLQDTPAV